MGISSISDFRSGQHLNTCPDNQGGLCLVKGADSGEWISPVFPATEPFDWAVASWNGRGKLIEVQVRTAVGDEWGPWFSYGRWSEGPERCSLPEQVVPGVGRMDTDTLRLERPADRWQMRIRLQQAAVKRVFLATARAGTICEEEPCREAWGVDLPVPCRSQMLYLEGGRAWCSPTSLAMVMAYWGRHESIPQQVAPGVYDSIYQGHGNWAFNVAYAATRGFVAYVDRFRSLADLERRIAVGIPVIASVAYQRTWLPNAPIDFTSGHLLVVRGFTTRGDVIVNDPAAAPDERVRLIYRRDLFRRAWLERGGVVYLIWPEGLSAAVQVG
ncbi:MAG TPA: peptidase C39 family protein [Symbiobacteriaceae bacterium]